MTACFADPFYYLALLSPDDAAHDVAREATNALARPVVTTAWVLTEVADAFRMQERRASFLRLLSVLQWNPNVTIVPPTEQLFARGIELYSDRSDKQWSLTDCISFVVMQERGLTEALTADRHFEQAGFVALLK